MPSTSRFAFRSIVEAAVVMKVLFAISMANMMVCETRVSSFAPIAFVSSSVRRSSHSKSLSFLSAVNPEDSVAQGEELILELDEDDYEEDTRTYEDFYEAFMKLQGAKKRRPDIGDQAQEVFDDMYEAYVMSDDPSLWPNTTIYNILLDTHAWSPAEDGGDKAQHILDRMEDMTVETIARPDVVSYMHVMEAWANRNAPEKAKSIMERLLKRFELTANLDVRPDTKAYNKLIGAWMKSNAVDNAEQAESVLKGMIDQYEANGNLLVLPNQKSFVQVMRCYGKRQTLEGLEKVRELLDSMKRLYRLTGSKEIQPDTHVYNELIDAIAQNKDIEGAAQQAESVLYEMMEATNMGIDALQPNAATFRHIIYGYKGVTDPGAAYKVMKLLELTQNVGVGVNAGLYNAAIQVIAWTREPEKAVLCWKLLNRMKTEGIEPTKTSYNNVLSACGHTFEPRDPKEIFRIAIEAFNELRDAQYMGPDVTSYGHFLRCCSELLPENAKRDLVVKNVFLKCCNDGQVGRFVLAQLIEAASEEMAEELLGAKPGDGIKIPRKWSQNIKDARQLLR